MSTQYAGGPITAIAVSAGGSGYTVAPTVSLSGVGAGTGATFTVNLVSGVVTSVTVTAGGHLYPISGVTATLTGGTGGSGATAGAVTVSGGDVNTTYTSDGTKQSLINGIETALLSAGWTTISGHATTNLLMQTVATPYPLQARFRFKDNGGSSIQISVENTAGTITGSNTTSAGGVLTPVNTRVFRVIANPYQAFIFVPGTFTTASTFVYIGVPFVPAFLTGITNCALVIGNATADADVATNRPSWRIQLNLQGSANTPNQEAIWNSGILQNNSLGGPANNGASLPNFLIPMFAEYAAIGITLGATFMQPYRWFGGIIHEADPILSWGLTTTSDEPTLKCILWDATILMDAYPGDSTSSWDSHNWWGITANNNGGNTQGTGVGGPRGTLFVVTP